MPSVRTPQTTTPAPDRRRWWKVSPVRHVTVVAYLALFMAMSGTAVAATGGSFLLGKANTADRTSTLTSSAGSALSLRAPTGSPPLQVNRTVKVSNLNADLLDGIDSSGLARLGRTNTGARTTLANPDGTPLRLTAKAGSAPLQVGSAVKVANLNADLLDGKDSTAFVPTADFVALQADHAALTARVAELEARPPEQDPHLAARVAELESLLEGLSRETVDGHDTVRFSDVNVQIVNGTGTTGGTPNGRGNLLLGYSAHRITGPVPRTGSHYLVVGDGHQWTRFGGIVAGIGNSATGEGASVLGGNANTASGNYATVSGGSGNAAKGTSDAVSGGTGNVAAGIYASVSGGGGNKADGLGSSVSGGYGNTATGHVGGPDGNGEHCWEICHYSSISGGIGNVASGPYASVSGGWKNIASAWRSSVSGGSNNTAGGDRASILGGSGNTVTTVAACHPACS